MLKRFILFLALPAVLCAQTPDGKQLIISLQKKASNKPCRSLYFKQTTNIFRNDSLKSSATWTEYLEYPDKLRIEFGDTATGNYVVFKNDSAYTYKGHSFYGKRADKNLIMLLLGGLYYRETSDVLQRITEAGIDLNLVSMQYWNKQLYYVIGAEDGNLNKPQIWIHEQKLRIDRFIENNNGTLIDVRVSERQKGCGTDTESKLDIYINGLLYQQELYYDIEYNKQISAGKFETNQN